MKVKRRTAWIAVATLVTLGSGTALGAIADWSVDPTHARVGFAIPHMMVSEVEGKFDRFTADVKLDEDDILKSTADITIDVSSIDTDNADRDKHLLTPDFFDAVRYPQITFKSEQITRHGAGYKVRGPLSMHGVTKQVTLDVKVTGPVTNPWGKQVRGVKVAGVLNRKDFGLTWNKSLDKGGFALGDEVTLDLKFELNK